MYSFFEAWLNMAQQIGNFCNKDNKYDWNVYIKNNDVFYKISVHYGWKTYHFEFLNINEDTNELTINKKWVFSDNEKIPDDLEEFCFLCLKQYEWCDKLPENWNSKSNWIKI